MTESEHPLADAAKPTLVADRGGPDGPGRRVMPARTNCDWTRRCSRDPSPATCDSRPMGRRLRSKRVSCSRTTDPPRATRTSPTRSNSPTACGSKGTRHPQPRRPQGDTARRTRWRSTEGHHQRQGGRSEAHRQGRQLLESVRDSARGSEGGEERGRPYRLRQGVDRPGRGLRRRVRRPAEAPRPQRERRRRQVVEVGPPRAVGDIAGEYYVRLVLDHFRPVGSPRCLYSTSATSPATRSPRHWRSRSRFASTSTPTRGRGATSGFACVRGPRHFPTARTGRTGRTSRAARSFASRRGGSSRSRSS